MKEILKIIVVGIVVLIASAISLIFLPAEIIEAAAHDDDLFI
jgi:hypothetical protein